MNQRSFSFLAGIMFTIIALLHLLRIIYGWDPVVEGWTVPKWISWVALIVSGYLGYEGLRLAHILSLRRKINCDGKRSIIHTVPGVGYKIG